MDRPGRTSAVSVYVVCGLVSVFWCCADPRNGHILDIKIDPTETLFVTVAARKVCDPAGVCTCAWVYTWVRGWVSVCVFVCGCGCLGQTICGYVILCGCCCVEYLRAVCRTQGQAGFTAPARVYAYNNDLLCWYVRLVVMACPFHVDAFCCTFLHVRVYHCDSVRLVLVRHPR